MARENRKDNRSKAKEAANVNDEEIVEDEKSGYDISDLLERDEDEDDEPDLFGNASKSESKSATPTGVDKEGAEDGDEEEVYSELTAQAGKEGSEVPDEEKEPEVEQKPELPEEAVPPSPEPTPKPEEVKAAEKPIEVPSETLSDEQAAELFTNWRSTTEDLLAKHHYKLSEADVNAFNENPAEFIPRYASKVYLDSISAAFQQFVTYLPRMVDQVLTQRDLGNANENMFFGRWPELKGNEKVVQRLGRAYRSQNPSASVEDFINEVGAQAMIALRKTPVAMAPSGNGAVPPVEPAKPFKPASNGPANERIQPAKPQNAYDALTSEFMGMTEEELDDN